jgi:acyl-CoA dehydrogenase family protein 9
MITRDSRILSIFEGTNEILRLYIALSGLKDVGATLSGLSAAVNDIFNNPIKGFGVLSDYARGRLSHATGIGTDTIKRSLSPALRKVAECYEKNVVELASASDALLRKHGKKIADAQYQQKRIADMAIDLFVGLCTLSRADSLEKANAPDAAQAVAIAEIFMKQARRRLVRNARALLRNEDDKMDALAAFVLERGSYAWDVI